MTDEPLVGYPEGQVLAGFESGADARQALIEMREGGFQDAELGVYAGETGKEALDSDGTQHGVTGIVVRGLQLLITDRDGLTDYESIVQGGGVVLAAHVDDDEQKARHAEIFFRNDGQYVRYFGAFTVEDLSVESKDIRAE